MYKNHPHPYSHRGRSIRRRVFELSAAAAQDMVELYLGSSRRVDREVRIRKFLTCLGFDLNHTIQERRQFDGSILYIQEIPNEHIPTYDLVSLIILEAGFPKERIQDVLNRAWEENRDPVEIANEDVALARKLEG